MEPAVAEAVERCIGLIPVAGHDHVASNDDLTDLIDRKFPTVFVNDAYVDVGARKAHPLQQPLPVRPVALVVLLGQRSDGHWRLALAVDLCQPGAENVERQFEIGEVHRCATVNDGLQVRQVARADCSVAGQPPHHGGGSEEGHPLPSLEQCRDLLRVDAARARDHTERSPSDVWESVET